jgi:hypothetical protein
MRHIKLCIEIKMAGHISTFSMDSWCHDPSIGQVFFSVPAMPTRDNPIIVMRVNLGT